MELYNTINLLFYAKSDSFHPVDYDKIVLWRIQINKMMITTNQSSHSHVSVLHGIMLRGFAQVFTPGKAVCKHDVIETNLCVKNEVLGNTYIFSCYINNNGTQLSQSPGKLGNIVA